MVYTSWKRFCSILFVVAQLTFFICSAAVQASERNHLDISRYHETFSETFRGKLDVTPWGPSRWIAHTPWHGDFGDAAFTDPQSNFPFLTGATGLSIIARKGADGKWQSGLLSSSDTEGRGFTQAGGYFEAKMKMPPGPGVWPAFWLAGHGDDTHSAEIDVVEYYGQFPDVYRANSHLWPKTPNLTLQEQGDVIHVPKGSLSDRFHTYGVEILDNDIVFYLDRFEVARQPASKAMRMPMSILANLALGSGWPIDKTLNPSILKIDYIKAFKRN
jgi:beta-glucanase (GH16 family)